MRRIALLAGDFRPRLDGVADYTRHLAGALARAGLEPVVLAARGADRPSGVPVRAVAEDWRARELPALALRVARLRPDVLHIQYAPASYSGRRWTVTLLPLALAAVRPRLPVFVTMHEHDARTPLDGAALLLLTFRARAVVAASEHHARLVRALPGRRPIHVLPVPANVLPSAEATTDDAAATLAALGLDRARPLVVSFGFLHPAKGLEYLIEGFARVAARYPNARLAIVGGMAMASLADAEVGRYRAALEATIARTGLEGRVKFTGYLSDAAVSALLSRADLGVLAFVDGLSPKSGSYAAMVAHGLPVVATRGPLTPVEGLAALLVPARDAAVLSEGMLRALGDDALRAHLRAAGRARALTVSWDALAAQHRTLYERGTTTRPRRRPSGPSRPLSATANARPPAGGRGLRP